MSDDKNIILFIQSVTRGTVDQLRTYSKKNKLGWRYMIMRDSKKRLDTEAEHVDIDVACDFSNPQKIAAALLPYQDQLAAVTSRGESSLAKMIQVIPHIPYLRTPTGESIEWSTDKLKMRRRLQLYDPKNTPKFAQIKTNTKAERARIAERVGFPMIIKPTNLSTSLLVSICYHEEELERTLRTAFRKVKKVYAETGRLEQPVIIAEEFMDGNMYSIDSYVTARGRITHCPIVSVKTGRDIGHDDFFNYLRITPTGLKRSTVEKAEHVAENAIKALGLRSTTTHTELMKIDDEWKVIEVGARIGGFRHDLHELSCDINHTVNDILLRLGQKPCVPKKCKGYAAALRYYPHGEGVIKRIQGMKSIQKLQSVYKMDAKLKVGDRVRYAKNGGKGVFDLTLYNKDRSKLLADIRRIEQLVQVTVENGRSKKTKSKKKKQ